VAAADNHPRLREGLENLVGRSATDVGLAVLSGLGQGLAGSWAGLMVDAGQRLGALAEARATREAWLAREADLLAKPELAETASGNVKREPVAARRPVPLPAGPVESWADQAGVAGLGAFGLGLPLTGDPRRAAGLALAAVPKAARQGREAFASALGRVLARRGAVLLDPGALRLLDRVNTVVLDSDILVTGSVMLGDVVPLDGADPGEVAMRLHRLFRPSEPTVPRRAEECELRPLAETEAEGALGEARRRLSRTGAVHVLALCRDGRPNALAAVVEEPSESVEALAAAAHRSRLRLVVAGSASSLPPSTSGRLTHAVLPGGDQLVGTVRDLQAEGGVVLLVSARRAALGGADVAVGVVGSDGRPPWGAQLLIGRDLELAALVIEACGPSVRRTQRRHGGHRPARGHAGRRPGSHAIEGVAVHRCSHS
jgi:hypothetical protein